MTLKLFRTILTICLAFGSLNLLAAQVSSDIPAPADLPLKKTPEAYFLDGQACLKIADTACARLALAHIPAASAYAKLLQGSIAFTDQQIDQSLLLLLPLQAEKNLNTAAQISLHQYLASAFEHLDDVQQAIMHLIQAEFLISTTALADQADNLAANHVKTWALLSKLGRDQLIDMRGAITDNTLQGWIDLSLASRNQDIAGSLADWGTNYAGHPAQSFAKDLPLTKDPKTINHISLPSDGGIALILPPAAKPDSTKADAFKLGLQAALAGHDLHNKITTYLSTSDNQQDIDAQYALAKNDGSIYFIVPDFNLEETHAPALRNKNDQTLHVGLFLSDEAKRIASFAAGHGMQRITIITTNNTIAKQMLASFQTAWQTELGITENGNTLLTITLPDNLPSAEAGMHDLKSQIAANIPDMVLLALPAQDAHLIKPYLDISTPTIAFSNVNETTHNAADGTLNAVRFVDIPFLLAANHSPFTDYQTAAAGLDSNELRRWFALGVDALQLMIAGQQPAGNEITISGLTGTLTVDTSGTIKRQLSVARFTYSGIVPER